MQDDGNLVVYNPNPDGTKTALWSTQTNISNPYAIYDLSYNTPKAAYTSQVPHASTAYDQGMVGAEATYYQLNSKSFFGAPDKRTTGIDPSSPGFMRKKWDTTSPIAIDEGMEGWGLRLTGNLRVQTKQTYHFHLRHNDGLRLWVDNKLLIDDWNDGSYRNSIASIELKPSFVCSFKILTNSSLCFGRVHAIIAE